MAVEKKQVPLRLSPALWDEINRWAEDEFRSVNGQIEYILSEAVKKRRGAGSETPPAPQGETHGKESDDGVYYFDN